MVPYLFIYLFPAPGEERVVDSVYDRAFGDGSVGYTKNIQARGMSYLFYYPEVT